jgi:hypothetical protein
VSTDDDGITTLTIEVRKRISQTRQANGERSLERLQLVVLSIALECSQIALALALTLISRSSLALHTDLRLDAS